MENIKLQLNDIEPINLLLFRKSSSKIAIFVSGSGDTKDSFIPIAKLLSDEIKTSLLSFSFRGRESEKEYPPVQQITDLKAVIDYLKGEGFSEISLMPTSMGFISVAKILSDNNYQDLWGNMLMLDPADYPTDHSRGTWSGNNKFNTDKPLYSDYLKSIEGNYKVNVVFFSLRNFTENYRDYTNEQRGIDNENAFSRLNINMTRNIYNSVPKKNQGDFVVDKSLPHAFSRDGNPDRNHKVIADYIRQFIL